MSEALARTRHDSVLSRSPGRVPGSRAFSAQAWLQWLRTVLPTRVRAYAGIILAVVMTGIVANALILQRERHPAPFFVGSAPSGAASAKLPPERPAPSASVEGPPGRPSPSARSSEPGGRPEFSPVSRTTDPIADILHNEASRDAQRLLTNAQNALIKLGYSIRTGESASADTIAAMRDFEKAHGLPLSNEVTPRLVKLLAAAANAPLSH